VPAADRPDPVALLQAQDAARDLDLVPIRHGRMMASPFTFRRGAAKIMAVDLAGTPTAGLDVQLCGDAHLSNFGAFAPAQRVLPGLRLRLPPRGHLTLDSRGIPTGDVMTEGRESAPIGRRTFDDGYHLGRYRRLAIESDTGQSVALHGGSRYPFAQVWSRAVSLSSPSSRWQHRPTRWWNARRPSSSRATLSPRPSG
jgi:Uncharacterized protein conserved in bacteria (DUF2252)